MCSDRPIGPFLYLPIEVAARELHAKLLLTHFAVGMGYEVVIGWKRTMNKNFRYMPPGVVMFKTLTARDGRVMAEAKAAGHRVAAIDEEVPGLVAAKQKLRWVAAQSVASSDLLFNVGAEHDAAMRQFHPAHADRYRVVGNPRWDLLRRELRACHAEETATIRQRYGPFILVNTNFAFLNSAHRSVEETGRWFVKTGRVDLTKAEDVVFLDEMLAMERANTEAVRGLIRELPAQFPNHRVIVRPHPIERTDTWSEFLRDIPRAEMVREGAVVPWIMGSDVLVHTNCTTGVEAFALDKPAISLQPVSLGISEIYLANRINYLTKDVPETINVLHRLIGAQSPRPDYPAEFRTTFERFFAATSGPFACQAILNAIGEEFRPTFTGGSQRPGWRPLPGYVPSTRTRRHHVHVMPKIDSTTVEQILLSFSRVFGTELRFQVEPCGQILFHVHGAAGRAEHALEGDVRAWLRRLWPRPRGASVPVNAA